MNSFRELKVWQKSMDLCVEVYDIIKGFCQVSADCTRLSL